MDDVEVFDINSEIIKGLFYIETDNYFPLRGNGWYYHPLTSYCLEKGIFSRKVILKMLYMLIQL
jgi:hypothetical protein